MRKDTALRPRRLGLRWRLPADDVNREITSQRVSVRGSGLAVPHVSCAPRETSTRAPLARIAPHTPRARSHVVTEGARAAESAMAARPFLTPSTHHFGCCAE